MKIMDRLRRKGSRKKVSEIPKYVTKRVKAVGKVLRGWR
jgi:hypothetical protein